MDISREERKGRALGRFRELLAGEELDGFIVVFPENRRYLSGFHRGSSGVLLVAQEWAVPLTDFRYLEQAAAETAGTGIDLQKQAEKVWESVAQAFCRPVPVPLPTGALNPTTWWRGITGSLAGQVGAGRLAPKEGLPGRLRMVKSPVEVELIAGATAITDRAWERLLPEIKPGRREEELAALFEFFQREEGASAASFPTLVASGPRSAMPHGAAGSRVLRPGDLVVVDGGAVYAGYCSDFTRTVVVGKEPGAEQERVYRLVLEAQERALAGL